MQKVITINLNGNACQIDKSGYATLVAYLEGAERQLTANPDRTEIVADLEQAIADKCRGVLGPHKTIVTATEVEQIIREMGPVDGAGGAEAHGETGGANRQTSTDARTGAPRRLSVIHDGAMIAGVCNGFAAYLNVDVTIVRTVFVGLMLVTWGGFGLAYLALAWIIPSAATSEEHAAARGQTFSAQDLIERAKKKYREYGDRRPWYRFGRYRSRQVWGRRWRAMRWQPHREWGAGMMALGLAILVIWIAYRYVPEVPEVIRSLTGVVRSLLDSAAR